MTTDYADVNDFATVKLILSESNTLLLDFDGPVCSVFSEIPAHHVAQQLRNTLTDCGHTEIPIEIQGTNDPFDVFKHAAKLGYVEAQRVEAVMRKQEVEAVRHAIPTPHAHEFINKWTSTGKKLAIVSNNSKEAVEVYLDRHSLGLQVHFISARTTADPNLLKPSPHLLIEALRETSTTINESVFLGDSTIDVQAGRLIKVRTIAYANKSSKRATLLREKPSALIDDLSVILHALGT
jgi:HAD superfamily hydrolase (TIGR01549 family)